MKVKDKKMEMFKDLILADLSKHEKGEGIITQAMCGRLEADANREADGLDIKTRMVVGDIIRRAFQEGHQAGVALARACIDEAHDKYNVK